MDDEVVGFGVEVRETGRKSFTLDYMFEGQRPAGATSAIFPTGRLRERVLKHDLDQGLIFEAS
jgi:hypothetical protein